MGLREIFLWLFEIFGLRHVTALFMQHQVRPNVAIQKTPQAQGSSVRILVIGRSGAGKSYLINNLCSNSDSCGARHSDQGTLDVKSHRTPVPSSRKGFRLIDTPGFHNINLSDTEVFCKIAEYFFNQKSTGKNITGIIYIHPAGDNLQSEALQRNVQVLVDLFLGESGLARLTVLITQLEPKGVDPEVVVNKIQSRNTTHTVFGKACAGGARILVARSISDFSKAVGSYDSENSITLPIHQYEQHNLSVLASRINGILDYRNSSKKSLQNEIFSLQTELAEIQSSLKSANDDTAHYQAKCTRLERLCIEQQTSKKAVDQQLQQIEAEYASLRSQYQLHNHIEQKDIVQGLKDLNFKIQCLGRAISEHLVDHYVQNIFPSDVADVTTLDAYDLPHLKSSFQARDLNHSKHSTLVLSKDGVGRDVDSFLEFALCTSLCTLLVQEIFRPFYPRIGQSQYAPDCDRLAATYREIQKQEPQYMAGKWRSITFKTICKAKNLDVVDEHIAALTDQFLHNYLSPLVAHFFLDRGPEDVKLQQQHFDDCRQLIKMAWEWNSRLKEEVIMLGDFEQTAYEHCSRFDPTIMEECEPNPRSPQPKCILGTLGLGLVSWQAVGGGHPPEKAVLCKAVVTTDRFYD